MHSIQFKTMLLTVSAIVAALVVSMIIGIVSIRKIGNSSSEQILYLMCESGEKNIDSYFESVKQSVETVSTVVNGDLRDSEELTDATLSENVEHARDIFEKAANKTLGALTYYYRIDPTVSSTVKGFWYTDVNHEGFVEHEVTDISKYDMEDTTKLVWFTVPRATGEPIWLPSYVTDNLDVRVISYNVPIYWNEVFVGVVGIEIDYSTLADLVDNIQLYNYGYAFVCDKDAKIVYHPHKNIITLKEGEEINIPDGFISESNYIRYTYEGIEKQAVWLPLSNGMRLVVTVPVSQMNGNWKHLVKETIIAAAVLLVVFIVITLSLTKHITKPLRGLTELATEVNDGNYDVKLDYDKKDEIGILTRTVNKLIKHLKGYISDLNSLAYGDALTSVRNKGAFDVHVRQIQGRVDDPNDHPEFAIGIFDCDELKVINDNFGHDKGDMYLKNSSHLICRVFKCSPVYRIGGDEFAVVFQNEDYKNREELADQFVKKSAEICSFASGPWEKIRVAMGIAVYDEKIDRSVQDVIRRADELMYENKQERKKRENN